MDFIVRADKGSSTFEAASERAKAWLVESGKADGGTPDAPAVTRDRVGAAIFLEALERKGFVCHDAEGNLVVRQLMQPQTKNNDVGRLWGVGCASLGIAIASLPVAGILYFVYWAFGGAITFVLGVLFAGFAAAAIIQESASKKKSGQDREGLKALDFSPDIFDVLGYGEYISIDKAGKRIAIKTKDSLHLRKFTDVVALEIEQDGFSVEKTNRGSQFDSALTGALLGGPTGMLMGGLSGSKRIEQKVHALTLNVFTRDLHAPTIKVPFLRNPAGAALDSGEYQKARKLAQDWYGRIRAVM